MTSVLLCAALLASPARPATPPPAVAFVGVSVVPMDSERVLDGQTVVVREGLIAAVGPSASTAVPAGALRIDARGRYLMPGLGDMHTHLGSRSELNLLVANGVTFVRNMWGSPLHLIWRRRIESGALLGPRLFTAGPLIDGKPPIWNTSVAIDTAEEATRAVEEQKAAGYDFLKVYSKLSPVAYDALVVAARKHGMPFAGHVPSAVGLDQALSSGQLSIEHLTGYLDAIQRDGSPVKEGPIRVEARGAQVRMRVADLPESRFDRPAGGDVVLMGPWVAAWVPVAARARDLAVGESRRLPEYVIEPPSDPVSGTLEITREPDEGETRVFTFKETRANAAHEGRMTVDASGLKTVELKLQIGVLRMQRK